MVDEQSKMILFVPGSDRNQFTDPSYHLPAFYELWSRWGPIGDRAFWSDAAKASREFFGKTTNPNTGLAPRLRQLRRLTTDLLQPQLNQLLLRFLAHSQQLGN